jgi:FecR protein
MSIRGAGIAALLIASTFFALPAIADDWVAAQLRGNVFVFIDDGWVQLHRGDIVPDKHVVRTQGNGRVTLVRGKESVAVGSNSQVEIVDKDGKQFTTVQQFFGTVEIEAEVRNVQHFAVVNPQLAAVVKGTHFTVTSSNGKGQVRVSRGHVEVENSSTHDSIVVAAGESVTTAENAPLQVAGAGTPSAPGVSAVITSGNDNASTAGGGNSASTSNSGNSGDSGSNTGSSGNGNGNGNNGNGNGNGGGDGSNGHGNGSGGNNSGGNDNSGSGNNSGHGGGDDNSGHGNGGGDNSGHGGGNGNGNSGHGGGD